MQFERCTLTGRPQYLLLFLQYNNDNICYLGATQNSCLHKRQTSV